ncbi:MAG: hypothetical protein OHK005_08460 [Candidatus Methylacidiphilales bacterium]
MSWELPSFSRDREPITYFGGVAIHLTTLLAVAHFIALLICTGLVMAGQDSWLTRLAFVSDWDGLTRPWTLLTFPFIHDIRSEGLFFVVEILVFLWLGRDVEGFVGHRAFALTYLTLILAPALLLVALQPLGLHPTILQGSVSIHFGVFIAFVTIYPNATFFFGLIAKWLAAIFLTVFSLLHLANGNYPALVYLWACSGAGFFAMRACGVGSSVNWVERFELWREARREQKIAEREEKRQRAHVELQHSVDTILDKIASSGLDSLSESERKFLEKARLQLLEQEKKSPPRHRR